MPDPTPPSFAPGEILTAADLNSGFAVVTPTTSGTLTPATAWANVPALAGAGATAQNGQAQALLNRTEELNPDNQSAPATLDGSEGWALRKAGTWAKATLATCANYVLGQRDLVDYAALRNFSGPYARVQLTAANIGGTFVQLASASGLADNGGTIIFDAAGRAWQRVIPGDAIRAEWFGWVGGEPGAVLNAAQAAAVLHGFGYVTYSTPNYAQTTPINATNGVVIRGPSMGASGTIRVAAAVAIDAQYQTPNFEAQYAAQPTMASQGVTRDFGLENVLLDGNCGQAQSTPVATNPLKGMGIRVYGARPRFRNVAVMRQPGIGVYSDFTATPAYVGFGSILATDLRDGSYFDNINVADTQFESLIFQGPSDITVRDIRAGWAANSLWSTTYSGKKSLMFAKGRLGRVIVTAGGSGYTQAGVAYSVATDATTAPTLLPVIVSGAVDHVIVVTPGSNDATYCNITFTGDGSGAAASGYVSNWVSGVVIFNKGAEFSGIMHSYNNAQGYAIDVRNDDSGAYPRFNAEFVMGESSLGGLVISDNTEYQIGRCDTHANGSGTNALNLPSLHITSQRGGTISNWKERREAGTGSGVALVLRGANNRVSGKVQGFSAYAADACVIGGQSNALDVTVANLSGFALATDYDCVGANVRIVSNANAGVWKNYANAATITNLDATVAIAAYGSVAIASAYTGLANLSTGAWKNVQISDKRSDTGGVNFSAQAIFGSVDLTNTAEQTITVNHNIVRTPQVSDVGQPQVKPNTGASFGAGGLQYAYVSAVTSTSVTVKVKLAAAGTGVATLQINIG